MALTLSLTAYSQGTSPSRSREITRYLAEGLEAKRILVIRNEQLRTKDSTIAEYKKIDSLWSVKDSLSQAVIVKSAVKIHRKNNWIKVFFAIALTEALALFAK